jgi:hypothetical protein
MKLNNPILETPSTRETYGKTNIGKTKLEAVSTALNAKFFFIPIKIVKIALLKLIICNYLNPKSFYHQ